VLTVSKAENILMTLRLLVLSGIAHCNNIPLSSLAIPHSLHVNHFAKPLYTKSAYLSMAPRRSSRLLEHPGDTNNSNSNNDVTTDQSEVIDTKAETRIKKRKKRSTKEEEKRATIITTPDKLEGPSSKGSKNTLPRTNELSLKPRTVIGVDEAGRGPIAGPVVAAAIIMPTTIAGITDSKKITKESDREALYELILSTPNLRYAIAVIDHKRIDEINILQATLEGMKNAVEAVIKPSFDDENRVLSASATEKGSYTVFGVNDDTGKPYNTIDLPKLSYHALIDGNKTPEYLSCPSNAIVKGDGKEYCIGAASILAKVTRDRIMREYHEIYPDYNLKQHKGYPTKDHLNTVQKIGGCDIHRRSFAPFKEVVVKKKQKITNFFTSNKK